MRPRSLPGPLLRRVLSPLSGLYGAALGARARMYRSGRLRSERAGRPVVSVGNLTFGGTGKTPFVLFLARRLRFEGKRPAIVSRGYGRRTRGVVVVSEGNGPVVGPDEGGDEPVAMALRLPAVPVVVGERRVDAARAAIALGADLLLLDDGYQHLPLARDVDILLLDAADPFGGGSLPPAGSLREPLAALARADAFVFTRVDRAAPSAEARAELRRRNPDAPLFTARIRAAGLADESGAPVDSATLAGRRFVAVCGIAHPKAFFTSLSELDLAPDELLAFPDHHRYGRRDLERIRRAADRSGSAWIATTEKDAVKLRGKTSLPVVVVRLEVEVAEPGFFPFLLSLLASREPEAPRTASAKAP
ncbi:MAG TPA: tetraacyldisaccharide 4'-kinase [Thermoanaerobaculia bacterium]|nr:tetraacyldisaccharide 4'-kinase [Thermoanaerobaculia bacterium]